MGREIELKIPLSKSQYDDLFSFINGQVLYEGVMVLDTPIFIKKTDEYYSRYNSKQEQILNGEPQVIRIRSEEKNTKQESYFTIKRKRKENGIEFNEENETYIENAQVLRDLFSFSGYQKYFEKCKNAWSCKVSFCDDDGVNTTFHFELEKVNELLYVEIECTSEQIEAKKAGQLLEKLVQKIGLNPKNKDSRSWMKIILEK